MKAIYHIKASLLTLAAMVACSEIKISNKPQDSINNGLLQELNITGKDFQFEEATRSSVTIGESGASFAWDEDDVIGIFPDKGDQVSFAMKEGAGTQTATFSGGGWALKSSAKYAAYYPHVYENRDLTAIPVSYIGQTQNGNANTDHIGAYDFMAAGILTPENGAVAFDMQHLGALIQLTITVTEPSTLSKVVLSSSTEFTAKGTIDLTSKIPSITAMTQSNNIEITLNNVSTTTANENIIVYLMTAPVNLTDAELTATIHFEDAATQKIKIKGKNLQAGKAYRLVEDTQKFNYYIDEYGINLGRGVEIDGVIWAPVNCGYHKTDYPYGKLYQWGRKYGQGYNGDATTPILAERIISLKEGQSESNQNVFFVAYNGIDWLYPQNDTLWNAGNEDSPIKTIYDPCPSGWRVPTNAEYTVLSQNHSSWTTHTNGQKGFWFSGSTEYTSDSSQIFLPAAGRRSYADGAVRNRGSRGNYWSSDAFLDSHAMFLTLSVYDNIFMNNLGGRADGFSVRCVQE